MLQTTRIFALMALTGCAAASGVSWGLWSSLGAPGTLSRLAVLLALWVFLPLAIQGTYAVALQLRHPSTGIDMLDPEVRYDIWKRQRDFSLEMAEADPIILRLSRVASALAGFMVALAVWPLHLRYTLRAQRLVHQWHAGGRGFRVIPGTHTFTGEDVHIPLYMEGVVNHADVSVIDHRRAAEGSPPLPPYDGGVPDFPLNEDWADCESCGQTTLSTTPAESHCDRCGQFTAVYWTWIEAQVEGISGD